MKVGPTIAFLLSELTGNYQVAIATALEQGLQRRGWGSVWFLGWPLVVPLRPVRSDDPTLDLLCQGRPAGILTAQAGMARFISSSGYQRLASRLPGIPLVALSAPVEGQTCVLMTNRQSIQEIVDHLVEVHNCRHIGFLRGASGQSDSVERYQGYEEALAHRGWSVDPSLVMDGEFDAIRAEQAVSRWLDGPRPAMDALVCANDDMATGAILAFSKRGIRVPQDILVTGFDAWDTTGPPTALTSIRQSCDVLIESSLDALSLEMTKPRPVPTTIRLPGELVLGTSCGCVSGAQALPPAPSGLVEALRDTLQRNRGIREVAPLLMPLVQGPRPTAALLATLLEFGNHSTSVASIADLAALGAELIEEVLEKRRKAAARVGIGLQTCAAALLTCQDWDELASTLLSFFPVLGVQTFFLSLYDAPVAEDRGGGETPLPPSRLLLAVEQGRLVPLPFSAPCFQPGDLVPPSFLDIWGHHGRTFLYLPLSARQDHFGGLVVEHLVHSDNLYEVLRSTLSNAIKLILAKHGGVVPQSTFLR